MTYELLASIIGLVGAMMLIDEMKGDSQSAWQAAGGVVMLGASLTWLWLLIK